MKNILCPTDFSQEANHAVEAGYYLADKFGGTLHLFHVIEHEEEVDFNVTGASPGGGGGQEDVFLLKLIEMSKKRMSDLASTPGLDSIDLKTEIKMGRPSKLIFEEINSGDYDMVVMGTKGVSGMSEILIGSNTEKVVRRSKIPVMAVKEHVDDSSYKNIVFATGLNEEEFAVVEKLKTLQEAFEATLHIVRINTPNNFQSDWLSKQQMKEFAEKFGIDNYTFNIFNDTIEEDGIIYFAEDVDAGMIAMSTHGRTGFAHLLSGSIAEDVVNHAKRPVLTYNIG